MPGLTWSPEEDQVLKNAWKTGGRHAAIVALPHRTEASISMRATGLGISRRSYHSKHTKSLAPTAMPRRELAQRTEAFVTKPPTPPAPEPVKIDAKVPDRKLMRDERERIRKRLLNFVIPDLARELGMHPVHVAKTIKDLAASNFAQDPSLRMMDDDERASVAYTALPQDGPEKTARPGAKNIA